MKAMILAAGRGERMRPLTDSQPKPLLTVAGRPLLDYPLERLARAGIRDVVINLAWHGQLIRDHVGDGSRWGLRVAYSDEGPQALETGGGVRHALPLLGDEPFWLVNGDVYSDYAFAPRTLGARALAHLVMVPNPPYHPGGDFCLDGHQVRTGRGPRLTYSGLAVVHPALVAGRSPGRFALGPLLAAAVADGAVTGERYTGCWTDVGTPARLAELDARLGEANQTSR
jgi:MurNAc alpha-1-phosphate uridylyltransferase